MKKKTIRPDFLLIPDLILLDETLDHSDRFLYGAIYWFDHLKDGECKASNMTLSEIAHIAIKSVQNGLTRLENRGYIKRFFTDPETRKKRSKIKALIAFRRSSHTQDSVSPTGDTHHTEVSRIGDTGVSPTGEQNKNSTREEELGIPKGIPAGQGPAGKEVNEIMYLFKDVNPSIGKQYGNSTQRAAIERMLDVYGRQKLEEMVRVLREVNMKPYWPKSTTPLQLENNIPIYKAKNEEEKAKRSHPKKSAIIT